MILYKKTIQHYRKKLGLDIQFYIPNQFFHRYNLYNYKIYKNSIAHFEFRYI